MAALVQHQAPSKVYVLYDALQMLHVLSWSIQAYLRFAGAGKRWGEDNEAELP